MSFQYSRHSKSVTDAKKHLESASLPDSVRQFVTSALDAFVLSELSIIVSVDGHLNDGSNTGYTTSFLRVDVHQSAPLA